MSPKSTPSSDGDGPNGSEHRRDRASSAGDAFVGPGAPSDGPESAPDERLLRGAALLNFTYPCTRVPDAGSGTMSETWSRRIAVEAEPDDDLDCSLMSFKSKLEDARQAHANGTMSAARYARFLGDIDQLIDALQDEMDKVQSIEEEVHEFERRILHEPDPDHLHQKLQARRADLVRETRELIARRHALANAPSPAALR